MLVQRFPLRVLTRIVSLSRHCRHRHHLLIHLLSLYRADIAASSHTSIPNIRVPFLAINAADDPIVGFSPSAEVEALSTSCVLAVTPYGGHLGWFENQESGLKSTLRGGPPPDRWVRRPVLEFIRACAEDFMPEESCEDAGRLHKMEDGLIVLEGKEDRVGLSDCAGGDCCRWF